MKLYYYILFILGFLSPQIALSQGLRFSGSEQPIDNRTSYDVLANCSAEFSKYLNINFDLALYPETQIGYIIRIKDMESNKIYNLFYDGQGSNITFKFNEEGKSCLITTDINKKELSGSHWFKVGISFCLVADSIKLTIHDHTFAKAKAGLADKMSPAIVFGKSDLIIDVPSFAIKNISVGNDAQSYSFDLRENEGDIVHDTKGKAIGNVSNPTWLINDSYHWKFKVQFKSQTVAGTNYYPDKKEIYYFNRDSIFIYNVSTGQVQSRPFEDKCPVKLTLGTNFIDREHNKLYAYEVYSDSPENNPSLASLNLDTYKWTTESVDKLPTQLHHHGSYLNAATNKYTIFGGFGSMRYSNSFYSLDLNTGKWQEALANFGGDTIFPRYFSSMGYSKKTNSIYIFGGMGNESGEQVIGRKYFYDLYQADLSKKRITKLWEIPWDKKNVVPVRGMVIQDSCFYTLCYPEYYTDSFLRLYRFSLKDGSYEILGDSIPIYSDRITTNANLYYDEQLNYLFATVQEFKDDIISNMKVYSLAFPPIAIEDLASYSENRKNNTIWIAAILSAIVAAAAGGLLYRRLKDKNTVEASALRNLRQLANKKTGDTTRANAIYLFGNFTVCDRQNKDITYMLSSKLKQTFCLILQHSNQGGISSQNLSHLLWPNKPEDKVKNSRGVTINNLRKILRELDGIELIHEKGHFKIVLTDACYCDYIRCMQIIEEGASANNEAELLGILSRGKFLKLYNQPIFDSFKEMVERKLEPAILFSMKKSFSEDDFTATVYFAEALFDIDPLNDDALTLQTKSLLRLKLNEEAQRRYLAFVNEYQQAMGSDYPRSFADIAT